MADAAGRTGVAEEVVIGHGSLLVVLEKGGGGGETDKKKRSKAGRTMFRAEHTRTELEKK